MYYASVGSIVRGNGGEEILKKKVWLLQFL